MLLEIYMPNTIFICHLACYASQFHSPYLILNSNSIIFAVEFSEGHHLFGIDTTHNDHQWFIAGWGFSRVYFCRRPKIVFLFICCSMVVLNDTIVDKIVILKNMIVDCSITLINSKDYFVTM